MKKLLLNIFALSMLTTAWAANDFQFDTSNPLSLLNETFEAAQSYRNQTLQLDGWQNVVFAGDRAWWGYNQLDATEYMAKATSYVFGETTPTDCEMWLVTPALDYNNAATKVFTFEVMSDILFEGQEHRLEVFYIDPTDPAKPIAQCLTDLDPYIPFEDESMENTWYPLMVSLQRVPDIVETADVFFMAFRFVGKLYNNGGTYYIDNVTWGVQELPLSTETVIDINAPHVQKILRNGQVIIQREGKTYNVLGREVK